MKSTWRQPEIGISAFVKRKRNGSPWGIFIATALTVLPGSGLLAQSYTWSGTGANSNWNLTANWSPTVSGGPASTADIAGTFTGSNINANGERTIHNFTNNWSGIWTAIGSNTSGNTIHITGTLIQSSSGTLRFRQGNASNQTLNLDIANIDVSAGGLELGQYDVSSGASLNSLSVTGTTTISAGQLSVNTSAASYSLGVLGVTGGTVTLNSHKSIEVTANVSGIGGTGTGVINASYGTQTGTTTLVITNTANFSTNVKLADGGAAASRLNIVKAGTGIQTFSGTNTYTGSTSITAGTLQFAKMVSLYGGTTASWTAANISVESGATLALNVGGTDEFTASDVTMLKNLGTATAGFKNGSILGLDTTNAAGGVFIYSGTLANTNGGANALGLTKLGTNTLRLEGSNTYSGPTVVSGGTLLAANVTALGTSIVSVNGTGTLQTDVANLNVKSLSVSGTGAVNINGSSVGTITLDSGENFSMSAGALVFGYDSVSSYDQILGSGAGQFSLTGGVINLSDSAWDYSQTYAIFSGFNSGSVSGISFTGYNTTEYLAGLSDSGILSFTAVPEPSTFTALISLLGATAVFWRRRRARD